MKKLIKVISLFLIFAFLLSNTLVFADTETDNEVLSDEYKYELEENIEDVFSKYLLKKHKVMILQVA